MFGSLVIVFPAVHEGGALALCHDGKEWIFDPAKELFPSSQCSVGYIAFYSDVEHEVLPVKSGYRVTLTYNLFFAESPAIAMSRIPSPMESVFKETLSRVLADPLFLPEGGHLGFGLRHQYPIKDTLTHLAHSLKGSDAVIKKVCADLSLDMSFEIIYSDDDSDDDSDDSPTEIRVNHIVDLSRKGIVEDVISLLRKDYGGKPIVSNADQPQWLAEHHYTRVWWVTYLTKVLGVGSPYVYYGNEASLSVLYGHACLIVQVGKPGQRAKLTE
jgi:hypothetical protein